MIYDLISNLDCYVQVHSDLYEAVAFARDFDPELPDGKYEIDGDRLFAQVKTYQTSPAEERRFETHRQYIDVQVLLQGCEYMGFYPGEPPNVQAAYARDKDVTFFHPPAAFSNVLVGPGAFVVFFPQDAHRPNCQVDGPQTVRKVVVKVRL